MSDQDGRNILESIRQLRLLMKQVSKMLLEADEMLRQQDWLPRFGSTAIAGGAYSINTPRGWLPYHVFRFYEQSNRNLTIPGIAVLLEPRKSTHNFTEPLVTGLILEYDAAEHLPSSQDIYDAVDRHLHIANRNDDGSPQTIESHTLWPKDSAATKMTSFAVPLVSITNRATLEAKVVLQLLSIIGTK